MATKNRRAGNDLAERRKLTDAERYKRFLDAAKTAEASNDPEDFEKAFAAVVKVKKTTKV